MSLRCGRRRGCTHNGSGYVERSSDREVRLSVTVGTKWRSEGKRDSFRQPAPPSFCLAILMPSPRSTALNFNKSTKSPN